MITLSRRSLTRLSGWLSSSTKATLKSFVDPVYSLDSHRTYSQYGEDAFLYAYFRGKSWVSDGPGGYFEPMRRGFYVDVGCYAPMECSNTYLFYKEGWMGINIDATPGVKKAFDLVRSRDINLQLAVSKERGQLDLFSWGEPCGFNTVSADVAKEREKLLGRKPTVFSVQMKPLSEVFDEWLPAGQHISFLTIDVEGHDQSVVESNNWEIYRPELVVVENQERRIDPFLRSPLHTELTKVDYRLVGWLPPSAIYADARLRM